MQVKANGIMLEVAEHGPKDGSPLILIRGLGTQMAHWPEEFVQGFAALGYRVVTFDNRDVGLSQRCPAEGVDGSAQSILEAIAAGLPPRPAYALDDMARDVVGLMDALGIAKAHIFGISMGGGIAQILATEHSDRLLSAMIVMTRARLTGQGSVELLLAKPETEEEYIATSLASDAAWGSPGFPASEDYLRDQAKRAYARGADPEGVNRQLLATFSSGDRRDALRAVDLPCYVIHGAQDALIPPEAGEEIAALIPGAKLEVIEGMGHVITPALAPLLVAKVDDFIRTL